MELRCPWVAQVGIVIMAYFLLSKMCLATFSPHFCQASFSIDPPGLRQAGIVLLVCNHISLHQCITPQLPPRLRLTYSVPAMPILFLLFTGLCYQPCLGRDPNHH